MSEIIIAMFERRYLAYKIEYLDHQENALVDAIASLIKTYTPIPCC